MTTLYFTSTGNCLMVAKRIGGRLLSVPQELHKETLQYEDDAIGLVFPVYGLAVPPMEFLIAYRISSIVQKKEMI